MAEQCGASPPTLALARTDVDNTNTDLTHGAGFTPNQASFGGDMRDTMQLTAACGKLLACGPQPDHLTHPHAAAGDAVVAATKKLAAPTLPAPPTTPQPTPDAADAEKLNAAEAAAQMAAAAAATIAGGVRHPELPRVAYDPKLVTCRISTPDTPTDLADATSPPDSPPLCRVELTAAVALVYVSSSKVGYPKPCPH